MLSFLKRNTEVLELRFFFWKCKKSVFFIFFQVVFYESENVIVYFIDKYGRTAILNFPELYYQNRFLRFNKINPTNSYCNFTRFAWILVVV